MRTRFIHDKFILDVSHLSLAWTEENSWFKDDFFLTSSFPFDIDYHENEYFEQLQHLNIAKIDTYYQGKLEKDGKIEEAVLEVEEANEKLRITIRYGVEALPNWSKKLSELELDVVLPDGGSMSAHAYGIINQSFPTVNYNFPAIHSKFYEGSVGFELFQGVINKMNSSGVFIQNYYDPESEENPLGNRNIVYPFPYHLYVLNKIIEDAGYTLHGDVLQDPDLIDAIITPGKKVVNFEGLPSPVEWTVSRDEIYNVVVIRPGLVIQYWHSEQELLLRGSFRFNGQINDEVETLELKLNGNVIFSYRQDFGDPLNFTLYFDTFDDDNLLECEVVSANINNPASYAASFEIITLQLYDENGNVVPQIANFSKVQLATMLPDMTVGEFIKYHKLVKNYDFDLRNNKEIWMNLIQNEVENAEVVDISEYDVKRPPRRFEQSKSFLLQYEGEYEEKYKYDKIYADRTGYKINDFVKSENTTELNINGIPLPIDTIRFPGDDFDITTAVQLTDDSAKLQLVKYNGLHQGQNWTQEMTGLKPLNLYLNFHQQWLNFIIHAVKFVLNIKDYSVLLTKIKKKSKLFSHNNYMFVFSNNRRRQKDIEEIDIEAYSSKV